MSTAAIAVDHRVVGLGEDREAVVLEALDEVHLPQRAGPVQRPAHDPRDEVVELVVGARARQRRAPHVVGHVEVLVVDPDRVRQVPRHPAHALAVARDEGDPVADQPDQALVVEPALGHLEDRHAAHVHGGGRLLHVQERHVQRAQAVTHHELLASQSLRRSRGRPRGRGSVIHLAPWAIPTPTGPATLPAGCTGRGRIGKSQGPPVCLSPSLTTSRGRYGKQSRPHRLVAQDAALSRR